MSDLETVNLVAAIVVSGPFACLAAKLIKRSRRGPDRRFAVTLALCGLVGLAQTWLTGSILGQAHRWGNLTAADVASVAAFVFAATTTFYKLYFAQTALAQRLLER